MNGELAILALKALDGLSLRSEVTAQNIANVGTAGYRPLRVSFENALSKAAASGGNIAKDVIPQIEAAPLFDASASVRLDLEMQNASATALRYAAVVDVLNRGLRIEALAISGSR